MTIIGYIFCGISAVILILSLWYVKRKVYFNVEQKLQQEKKVAQAEKQIKAIKDEIKRLNEQLQQQTKDLCSLDQVYKNKQHQLFLLEDAVQAKYKTSQQLNEDLEKQKIELTKVIENINSKTDQINKLNNIIKQLQKKNEESYEDGKKTIDKNLKDYEQIALKAANNYDVILQEAYQSAEAAHQKKIASLNAEYTAAAADLQKLKDTRKAAYEALLKQQEVKQNKDNYRLNVSYQDFNDIHSLKQLRKHFNKPRVISMLIWQYYYQPIAKQKFPVILKSDTKMGIYKITNIETNQSYIGQAVDIYKRWTQHCKAGLGIDTPANNKLYKAMQEYGLENFTFELLCECCNLDLNEKERYFINLYQADIYGYNGNAGKK